LKPQNVTDHEHYFAFEEDEENGGIIGRFDACETRDDGSGIWSPESGSWYPAKSYEHARLVAEQMAALYKEHHPR
jgi:hypothetical protein